MDWKHTNEWLATRGVEMSKQISHSFFGGSVFDKRRVYSFEEISKLGREGFGLEDAGINTWNLLRQGIMHDIEEFASKKKK